MQQYQHPTKIVIIVAAFFILWSSWKYTKPINFPIKRVKIVASYQHVEPEVLRKLIATYTDNGFFYLNVIGMQHQILGLPWVYKTWIQRKWPDTIIVNIIEQQPLLQWDEAGLLNTTGELFTPPKNTFPNGLPIISGPEQHKTELFILYKKMQQLLTQLTLSIKKLTLIAQSHWEIILTNNTVLYLKEHEPLKQLQLLVNIYPKIAAEKPQPPQSIDLRYNTPGVAVRW